ncbi:MAG: hypothetical protein ACYTG5_10400 [Planctomycetota bacterium]
MSIQRSRQAEYAIPPGTPALQVNPQRLRRCYAICVLTLVVIALGLGYLLGRFQGSAGNSAQRVAAMHPFG